MEKIPTAKDFAWSNSDDFKTAMAEQNYQEIYRLMIEFAKLHRKAILDTVANKVELTDFASEFLQEGASEAINKDSILNAYPESNIQ